MNAIVASHMVAAARVPRSGPGAGGSPKVTRTENLVMQVPGAISSFAPATILVPAGEFENLKATVHNLSHQNAVLNSNINAVRIEQEQQLALARGIQMQLQNEIDDFKNRCSSLLREKYDLESESRALRLFLGAQEQKVLGLAEENKVLFDDRASEAGKFNNDREKMIHQIRAITIQAVKATSDLSKELDVSAELRKELMESRNEIRCAVFK